MLKMIIIEDEKLEREGLVDFFDWNSMEVQIVGTACDGIEGIELAQKTKPDIIITDIKMPGMNGLDMSNKIKEILPQVKIIILTGYGDFNYAKQAISISVSAYILKPIEEEELISTVKNIVLDYKKSRNTELILSKEYNSEKLKFFMDLLQGKLKIEEFNKNNLNFGINYNEDAEFAIAVIGNIKEDDELFQILISELKNIINENICFLVPIVEKNTIFMCLCIPKKQNIRLEDICGDIVNLIQLKKLSVLIGIGTIEEHIIDIKKSAKNAVKALEYGLFWYDSGIFYYKDILYNINQIGDFITRGNKLSKQLVHAVGCSEDVIVQEVLKEIFELVNENKNVDNKYICNYLYSIIYETSLMLYNLDKNNQKGITSQSEITNKNDFGVPLLKLKSLKLISEYTYNFFENILKIINEKRNNKDENIIKTVIRLIEEGYMRGISLKIIAAQVYLSPNYLGHIFKKYIGKSFNDYLCGFRMEKAKELLKDSNKKISSVSKEIGISNTSYFCMVFKNIYGMAPKEYQEMMLRN